jgi:predicted RNase H-like HicB family nuclease
MSQYLIVIEPTGTGFSAYAPDLPGCVSTGQTRQEVEENIKEAIAFHLDGLREEGLPVPQPRSEATLCTIRANPRIQRTRR